MDSKDLWLALNMVPGMTSSLGHKLYKYFGSVEMIFKASVHELRLVERIGSELARRIVDFDVESAIKKEKELMAQHKVDFITFKDRDYPGLLKQTFDPPLVLYIKGELKSQDNLCIAIVGSRRPTLYGKSVAQGLASKLAGLCITVVSGMARGIDSMAHRGALSNKGRTIAVLGSGIDYIYPPENRSLAEQIRSSGALISEFSMGTPPLKQNFPMRNRIISALSLGTLVVEAGEKSGALITARLALEQGREVFAVPGQINSWASKGTNGLIKQGAKLVEDIKDIIEELGPHMLSIISKLQKEGQNNKGTKSDRIDKDSGINPIVKSLADGPLHVDSLIEMTGISAKEIFTRLIRLEMEGIIKQLPGNIYTKV